MTAGVALVWAGTWIYHAVKPLPDGTSIRGPVNEETRVTFLSDLTYLQGQDTISEQEIFDHVFRLIDAADHFVVADFFLFNGEHGGERAYPPLALQLADRLIAKKLGNPRVEVVLITDEINNFYGAYTSPEIRKLRTNGVSVITTRLERLRDSNPLYSSFWRVAFSWLGTSGRGWLPHPLSSTGRKVTARSYLKLLNFKANHRKLVVTDRGCIITSANPHDASALHSNIAFELSGAICRDMLESERGIAEFSRGTITGGSVADASGGETGARLLTEGAIRDALLADIERLQPGDELELAMFYLSDRDIVKEILGSANRGARVRLVLDPNKDAFGREKGGIPNRQVAQELVESSAGRISLRWYDTHGEQFHTKLVYLERGDTAVIYGGSANLTRRNVGDYNLEADVRLVTRRDSQLARDVRGYLERIWSNEDGHYTVPFDAYRDESVLKTAMYRIQEMTGFSSF